MILAVEGSTGLYGIKKDSLKKYRCRIGGRPYIYPVSKFEVVDINTEEDLKIAEYIGKCFLTYKVNRILNAMMEKHLILEKFILCKNH